MTILAIGLFVAFILASLGQVLLGAVYSRHLRAHRPAEVPDSQLPKAAVVLCLRGADPFLDECLERLARQDYPRFAVRVIIDAPDDPARRYVEQWIVRHPELEVCVEFLQEPFETCTLYCSSIHQAVRGLDESIEAVAFINADTMPHADWLRALVSPLADSRVGAVTGNRWYLPATGRIGSLVRYVQNAFMVMVMYFLDLIWGGSLCLKRAVFAHPKFLEQLRQSSCEDHAVHAVLKVVGLRLEFTPAVMMVNGEECGLGSAFGFLRRQMLWTRLYNPGWASVLWQAVFVGAVTLTSIVCFWTAVAMQEWAAAGWVLAGAMVCILADLVMLAVLHGTIGRLVARDQGLPMGRFRWSVLPKFLLAAPMALFVFLAAAYSAAVLRRVDWRGVSYHVVPPSGVRLSGYCKYRQAEDAARHRLSL